MFAIVTHKTRSHSNQIKLTYNHRYKLKNITVLHKETHSKQQQQYKYLQDTQELIFADLKNTGASNV